MSRDEAQRLVIERGGKEKSAAEEDERQHARL